MHQADGRWHYNVMSSPIGWMHIKMIPDMLLCSMQYHVVFDCIRTWLYSIIDTAYLSIQKVAICSVHRLYLTSMTAQISCKHSMECKLTIKWYHPDMEMFSLLLALCEGNPMLVDSPHKSPVIQSFDVLSLMVNWTNCTINRLDANDLIYHEVHGTSL